MIYFHLNQIKETVNFSVYQTQNSSSGKIGISHQHKERNRTQMYVQTVNFLTFQSNLKNIPLIGFRISLEVTGHRKDSKVVFVIAPSNCIAANRGYAHLP